MHRMWRMSSHGLSTPWNVASSNSSKLFCKTFRFQEQFAYIKHYLIVQAAFFDAQKARKWVRMAFRHHETPPHRILPSRFLIRPEGRLWVLRAIRLLRTSLKELRESCYFPCPWCRKLFRMVFRHLDTSLHSLHQRCFIRRPEARLWVQRAIRFHKSSLQQPRPNRFFSMSMMQKMSSRGLSTPWNIDFNQVRF
jgi:hypothetical protein